MTSSHGLDLLTDRMPHAHLLSNGRYRTAVSAAGSGFSSCGEIALTRWRPDLTRDADGFFFYIAEPSAGQWWSAGFEPCRGKPDEYLVSFDPGVARLSRRDGDFSTALDIMVDADRDAEYRRLSIVNHSGRPRTLEVTSFAEVALNHPAADAGHPAFSKLFISTERVAGSPILLARRRPRGADEHPIWLAHSLVQAGTSTPGTVETDRMRFLGRNRSASHPVALEPDRPLSGTVGNVLDPVMVIRHRVTLEPGGTAILLAHLSFGQDRAAALAPTQSAADWDALLAAASLRDQALRTDAGIDEVLAAQLPRLTGALLYGFGALIQATPPASGAHLAELRRVAEWWRHQGVIVGSNDVDRERRLRALATLLGPRRDDPVPLALRDFPAIQPTPAAPADRSGLSQWNGTGGFSTATNEYVISTGPDDVRPPQPWTNVMANEQFGTVVSESGAACTWSGNSREYRLTPWFNDPVTDPTGEALYLHDLDSGQSWSPTPGPRAGTERSQATHGFGHSRWWTQGHDLDHWTTQFVMRDGALKLTRVAISNRSPTTRRLALYSFAQLVLGSSLDSSIPYVTTDIGRGQDAILAHSRAPSEFAGRVAVAALLAPQGHDASATGDRTAFLGRHGEMSGPESVIKGTALDGEAGHGLDPCAAFRIEFEIPPRGTFECMVLLGEAESEEAATALVDRFRQPGAFQSALESVTGFWRQTTGRLQVESPVPALDLMLNGWLVYQNLSCRMWGRTAFYQSGGAFGFRDQLQDSLALIPVDPSIAREQIVLHAAHQFVEGDVLHWWHPPASKGIRTRFADDLLWLPFLGAQYVQQTGDRAVLDVMVPFLRAPALKPGEDEVFLVPGRDTTSATVYEHCCRAIDRSLAVGVHGLPLFGTGDWNDGMNRVGREGKGESVWMGFFLARTLEHFVPIAERRGDRKRAERYREHRNELVVALNQGGWDGEWYRRGYFDDGTPLGSAQNDECRIDAIAQAWAVLSGVAPEDRARSALAQLEAQLVSEPDGIIRLLTPPFNRTEHDPGYIKGYLPGVRENGGQYTHGALWAVQALAEAGDAGRAAALLTMISPVTHARNAAAVARYQVEPYVIAADVYGVEPHVGRGGWTWYTGSAGWMFRVALESIFGVTLEGGTTLVVRPAMPAAWDRCAVTYRPAGTASSYRLTIRRDEIKESGGVRVTIDGAPGVAQDGTARIPLAGSGPEHVVEVVFDRALRLSYRQRL